MKVFIILTAIGTYLALGIFIISLVCKITSTDIDLGNETDVTVIGFCIITWPLVLIAIIVILFFKGLSYSVNLVLKAFNNNK